MSDIMDDLPFIPHAGPYTYRPRTTMPLGTFSGTSDTRRDKWCAAIDGASVRVDCNGCGAMVAWWPLNSYPPDLRGAVCACPTRSTLPGRVLRWARASVTLRKFSSPPGYAVVIHDARSGEETVAHEPASTSRAAESRALAVTRSG